MSLSAWLFPATQPTPAGRPPSARRNLILLGIAVIVVLGIALSPLIARTVTGTIPLRAEEVVGTWNAAEGGGVLLFRADRTLTAKNVAKLPGPGPEGGDPATATGSWTFTPGENRDLTLTNDRPDTRPLNLQTHVVWGEVRITYNCGIDFERLCEFRRG
ncbi:hypothetical protein D9V34_02960 [Mycetocola lacteus]|uniref:Uncharacterized protein n=1 Tax=Mycetocola lacteus TaxID=76637 RepID=A0A3L7AUU1_9MICO|nr:hypothetical protein [Mycetocola lacteus]RLP83785.1 hypothetical protein D9V34_02960 [Mycetocola lacteus]